LLLVMARYLGVRVPSEIVPLKWTDVDWENSRIVITSPKTKRHKDGEKRVCPIFPEVLPALREAWEAAPEGAVWIFPSVRHQGKNLRTWLERAIIRAGRQPWPRLWQNMRATRATELADQFPSHVASAWLEHSEQIADRHYRQTTGTHYARAIAQPTGAMPGQSEKLAQNPAQSPHVSARQGSPREERSPAKHEVCGAVSKGENTLSGGHEIRTRNPTRGHHISSPSRQVNRFRIDYELPGGRGVRPTRFTAEKPENAADPQQFVQLVQHFAGCG